MKKSSDPTKFDWNEIDDPQKFGTLQWRDRILQDLTVCEAGSRQTNLSRARAVLDLLNKHTPTALTRLKGLESRLNNMFTNKSEIIRMVIVAAIAQQPMLLIGPPGTAKSKIIMRFCEGLGVSRAGSTNGKETAPDSWFQYLLHSFTEPDEILGPVKLQSLQGDSPTFERFHEGSITEADVVFLDEVFKANSAILNSLLTIINERHVYEGGVPRPARARLIYAASNATPTPQQLKELRAFYERFIIRMESNVIPIEFRNGGPTPERQELLKRGWEGEVRELRAGYDPVRAAMEPVACLNYILFLNRAVTELWGGDNLDDPQIHGILHHYHDLVTTLGGGSEPICTIDDRKFIRLFLVVRAHALYDRNGPPVLDDLRVLKHIWDDTNSVTELRDAVTNFINSRK